MSKLLNEDYLLPFTPKKVFGYLNNILDSISCIRAAIYPAFQWSEFKMLKHDLETEKIAALGGLQ